MSEKAAQEFVRSLELLSNRCNYEVDLLLSEAIRKMDGSERDDEIIAALLAAIMLTMNKYVNRAVIGAETKNKGKAPIQDLTINGENAKDRMAKYLDDLKQNVSDFIDQDANNISKLTLGLGIIAIPEFLEVVTANHLRQIRELTRAAGSSALFASNIDRNVFGNIFYAGRLAESHIWQKQGVKAIKIVTQGDNSVCEQCKAMAGIYPYDYVFVGNHPRCRCRAIPVFVGRPVTVIPQSTQDYMVKRTNQKSFGGLMIFTLNPKYYARA